MNQLAWAQKLKVFSETQKKVIIEDLKKIVQNGVYGKDYTVAPREKNRQLKEAVSCQKECMRCFVGIVVKKFRIELKQEKMKE